MKQLLNATVCEQSAALAKGAYSSVELTRAYLARIREADGEIGAYLTVTEAQALRSAEESDRRRASGKTLGALDGIPFALKDNICTEGIETTCASRMLAGYIPPYSATVVEKLLSAGAVLLGKLNMDEFAMGSSNEYSSVREVRNPLDPSRVPGGSSGGCAAAVAAKEASFTLGSDTGGSVRQPSAFCGTVGMKPTYGTVSRYGLVAFAPSLEQIGPMTADIRDNALILGALVGKDPRDATSISHSASDFGAALKQPLSNVRIGIPKEYFGQGLDGDVKTAVLAAIETYRKLGAKLLPISLPTTDVSLSAYYIISSAEASSNLGRFDGVRYGHRAEHFQTLDELYQNSRSEGFGREVKRRILLGTFVLSEGYYDAYYKKALQARTLVMEDFRRAFEVCDCILSPTAPTVAYKLGERMNDPLSLYLGDLYSVPANIAGLPALSLPCGTGEGGMPVGLQLMGPAFSEALLYRVGYALECARKKGGLA